VSYGKRFFLKGLGIVGISFLISLAVVLWRLPMLLTLIGNHQLANNGSQQSSINISEADLEHLSIDYTNLSGAGWEVQLNDSLIRYEFLKLIKEKQADVVVLDTLHISINPAELEDSDEPLTILLFQNLPAKEIKVKEGRLTLILEEEVLEINWTGKITTVEDETLVFTATRLQINQLANAGDRIVVLPELQDSAGVVMVSLAKDGSQAGLTLNLVGIQSTGTDWGIDTGSLTAQLGFEDVYLAGLDLADNEVLFPKLMESLSGTISMGANQLSFQETSSQWISGAIEFIKTDDPDTFTNKTLLSSGIVTVGEDTVEQVNVGVTSTGSLDSIKSDGEVTFLFEGIEGGVLFNQTTTDPINNSSIIGEYHLPPLIFNYSDLISRKVASIEDLSFSGSISAEGDYQLEESKYEASARIEFTEGSIIMPSKELSASGIKATVDFKSIPQFTSTSGESNLSINLIQLGDLDFTNTQLSFDIEGTDKLFIPGGHTNLFDGTLTLEPATILGNPLSFETALRFDRLSLGTLVESLAFFDGSMEGAISGYVPITYKDSQFLSGEGYLGLSDNEPARMRYKTKGLLHQEIPKDIGFFEGLANRIIGQLKLAPEQVVEDALSDLAISELRVDLLSSDTPETPLKIRLSGEGKTGETPVPLILDTNINGTLEELFNFLLRINSIGTPSLQ
jgi:hypothetical protein